MERLFIAVKLPQNVKTALSSCINDVMKKTNCPMTPVKDISMHITLAFLGDTDPKKINEIKTVLSEVAADHKGFSLAVDSLGSFSSGGVPRTLLAHIGGDNEALAALQKDVSYALDELGLDYDRKAFKPHITIARIRNGATPQQISILKKVYQETALPDTGSFDVKGFTLFKSDLTYAGPVYTPRAEFSLTD